ncbi:MAG: CoA transferase, partial [Verrucomicrobia bacterium]|nr:CoA transferase [Verrucomicrobiota bacterium]
YAYTGLDGKRESPLGGALPLGIFPCKDGFVNIVVSPPGRWPRFLEMLGRGDLIQDSEIRRPGYWVTPQARELVDTLLYPWLLDRTKQEVFEAAQRARIAAAPLNTPTQVLVEPHLQVRGYFTRASHPAAGPLPYTGPSFRMEEGWKLRSTAPLLGQHNQEVLCGLLGLSPAELTVLRETGAI